MAAQGPNILFVLVDDLGWGDIGALYQNGRAAAKVRSQPWESTPCLDRLAGEGVLLTDHYCAAPVCAPSRASLMLGLSQGHANVRDNQFDKELENNHTLANVLKQAGYATVAVGKWGLQGGKMTEAEDTVAPGAEPGFPNWPAYPTKRGFDYYFGYVRHSDGHEHYPKEAPYTEKRKSKQVWDGAQNITPQLDKCYTADLWTAWAKRWIVEHERTNAAQPFFMYLAYDTPHAATELPTQAYPEGGGLHGGLQWLGTPGHMINTASGQIDSWIHPDYRTATYDNDDNPATPEAPWPDVDKRYATAVRRLDSAVGDLQKLLQDLRIDRDTLVIFTSDNGPSIESYLPKKPLRADFFDSFGPFDGIKRDCWEGGVRVPVVARWPGHIPAGKVDGKPGINYDWLPTFAEAAGLPIPANADGISLLPELTGQGTEADRGCLYVEYYEQGRTPSYKDFAPSHRGRKREQMQTIRLGDFVGVRYDIQSPSDPFEIYNVKVDPKEVHNLAAQMPGLDQRLHALAMESRRPNPSAPRPYDDELVPASTPGAVVAGVEWRAYDGTFPWVPKFDTLKPAAIGRANRPSLEEHSNGGLFFTGYLKIPRDGNYTFYLTADAGALLRLHDATVIDADYGYTGGKEVSGGIRLAAGLQPFRLYYTHKNGAAALLNFSWSGPGMAKAIIPDTAFAILP